MKSDITGGYKDLQHVPCCTKCGQPKDEIVDAFREVVVIKCAQCDSTVASGYVLGLRVKCYKCGAFISAN